MITDNSAYYFEKFTEAQAALKATEKMIAGLRENARLAFATVESVTDELLDAKETARRGAIEECLAVVTPRVSIMYPRESRYTAAAIADDIRALIEVTK